MVYPHQYDMILAGDRKELKICIYLSTENSSPTSC